MKTANRNFDFASGEYHGAPRRSLTCTLALSCTLLMTPPSARGQITDCNGNGIADNLDIAAGTTFDCNANSRPDECDLGGPALWTLRATSGPSPRYGHAMAYDSARGVTVLFGGNTALFAASSSSETWEWDGNAWSFQSSGGPSPRYEHAMAFDSARGVTVLFGGYDGAPDGETWEWDGSAWELRSNGGPSPRGQHFMAYDSARGVTTLHGGINGGVLEDTWEWDGITWTQRTSTGPASCCLSMAYDSARGVTVLLGLTTEDQHSTWEWDGVVWTLRTTGAPAPHRFHSAAAYDSTWRVAVLFGGFDPVFDAVYSDTWDWDGSVWSLRNSQGSTPPPRHYSAMAYDGARNETVLFGGIGQVDLEWANLGDTWMLVGARSDCNANGVPDQCESLGACAHIVGAKSWRTHGNGVGRDDIGMNAAGQVALGTVTSEPRAGGIAELRIGFHAPPGGPGSTPVSIEQRTCGDGGTYTAYAGASTSSASVEGLELVLIFTPALENARTYRFTLAPEITAAANRAIEVRGLAGDADSSGRVDALDRSVVVGAWTGAGYSTETDIDTSGRTDALDRSMVVGIWTGAANCAP